MGESSSPTFMPARAKPTLSRAQEMHALYTQGASMDEVAERFGIAPSSVSRLFKNYGLKTRGLRPPANGYPVGEMYRVYQDGATMEEVAERFDVSPARVSQLFKSTGLETRPRGVLADHPVEEMYEIYEQGATLEEVGICFNITRERVRQIFRDAGLSTRRTGSPTKYSDEELLDCLRVAADALGGALSNSEYSEFARTQGFSDGRSWPLNHASRFGSWKDALKAAGVPLRRRKVQAKKKYSDAELISCMKQANRELGGVLTHAAYDEFALDHRFADGRPWPTWQTPSKRFGTWVMALKAAGLRSNPSAGPKKLFDVENCLDAVRTVARELGKTPTVMEYDEFARESEGALPSLPTIRNRCGSWSDAVALAGV